MLLCFLPLAHDVEESGFGRVAGYSFLLILLRSFSFPYSLFAVSLLFSVCVCFFLMRCLVHSFSVFIVIEYHNSGEEPQKHTAKAKRQQKIKSRTQQLQATRTIEEKQQTKQRQERVNPKKHQKAVKQSNNINSHTSYSNFVSP